MSAKWFVGFCRKNKISLRRKTHALHNKTPEQLRKSISGLHAKTLRERERERCDTYTSRDLTNTNQTPLLFVIDDNKTYDKKGAEGVWIASGQPGLEKRQCTIQLTVFADGKTLPPLEWGDRGVNPVKTNPTKWSNTLKLATNFLSVSDHFVKLALKGLRLV